MVLPGTSYGEKSVTFVDRNRIGIIEDSTNTSNVSSTRQTQPERYKELSVDLRLRDATIWCHMMPTNIPTYSHEMMADILSMQKHVNGLLTSCGSSHRNDFRWFVMASGIPGIFNLGGDLAHFAERIRRKDLDALRHYGHVAVEAIYNNTTAFGTRLITMALVQGDALGGGFEHALSFDLIVAERGAKFGLPEILFNMFPGMGAYSFLSRRLDRARAEALMLSGRIHTAAELHSIGIVDVLVEDGEGEAAVQDYIARRDRTHNAHLGVYQSRRRVNPVTLSELKDVVDIWAEATMNLSDPNLRKMERLRRAQNRRMPTNTNHLAR